jgi:2-polyprenyl-3-methyl-5-hydroxy-6-metoxy-1,4-benzoquinol methylase
MKNKETKCPLCNSCNDNAPKEEIKKTDIVKLYKKAFDLDVTYLIKNDFTYIKCRNCDLGYFYPAYMGDDYFYSSLNKQEWYYLHEDKTEFEFSKKHIDSTMSVLDIGSGRGVFSKYIDCKEYVGLELSENAIDLARKDGVNVLNQSIENYSNNNKIFDVVVSFQVLEHIFNFDSFLSSTLKILKNNGTLIIAVPNSDSFIKYSTNNILDLPPHHVLRWNKNSLKYLAKRYNLNVVEVFKENITNIHKKYFYTVIIRKTILGLFGIKTKLVDSSKVFKIINITSKIISILLYRFLTLFQLHHKNDGQTIIIVFKKHDRKN